MAARAFPLVVTRVGDAELPVDHGDHDGAGGVVESVADEVVDQHAQEHRRGTQLERVGCVRLDRRAGALAALGPEPRERALDRVGEVRAGGALVDERLAPEHQEGFDQRLHLVAARLDPGERAARGGIVREPPRERLRRAADHRHGRSELVRGEAAELALARDVTGDLALRLGQRPLDRAQLRVRGIDRHRRVTRPDPTRLADEPAQGAREAPYRPPARQRQPHHADETEREGERVQAALVPVEVIVGIVLEDDVEKARARGMRRDDEVLVLRPEQVLVETGRSIGGEPGGKRFLAVVPRVELQRVRGSGPYAAAAPLVGVARELGIEPAVQADPLHRHLDPPQRPPEHAREEHGEQDRGRDQRAREAQRLARGEPSGQADSPHRARSRGRARPRRPRAPGAARRRGS